MTLPVAEVFGPAAWGLALPESSQQHHPVVTADRVVFLDGDQVRAVDSAGTEAWATPFEIVDPETRTHDENNYPVLHQADPQTVAVIDQGKVTGEGLNEDAYAVKVTLLNIETGSLVKAVTVPGTASGDPEPSKVGLAFTLPNGSVSAVLPTGEVTKVPASHNVGGTRHETDSGVTVGHSAVATWGADEQNPDAGSAPGFAGQGWDSLSTAPDRTFTSAEVAASDAAHLLVGRWVVPGSGPDAAQVQVQVLDAGTGKVLSSPACEPDPTASTLVSSPNRSHLVSGSLRLDSDGKSECVGGGEGQKRVSLTAVTDDGRAFGSGSDGLVDVAVDGTAKMVPMPDGAGPPIGIMTGDVAVHWDPSQAVITGNHIR